MTKKQDKQTQNNKHKFYIITDSSSDITQDEAKKYDIKVFPLDVTFPDGKVYRDCVDFSFKDFYEKLSKCTKELPKTSQPNPGNMADILKKYSKLGEVLYISISSNMSSTYESVQKIIREELSEESAKNVNLFDSFTVTMQLSHFVFQAIKLRDEGRTVKETLEILTKLKERTTLYAFVEDLKYLKMGGRIKPITAIIGNLLNLKPIITIRDGMVENIGKSLGLSKVYSDILNMAQKDVIDTNYPIFIGHSNNLGFAERFKLSLEQKGYKDIIIRDIGATVGTHIGPNCSGIVFIRK